MPILQDPAHGDCTDTPVGPLLILAARCGKTSIMDLLLSRGADVDATDAMGGRPCILLNHWATYGSLPALRVLLSHGADVNWQKIRISCGHPPHDCTGSLAGPDSFGCFCVPVPILSIARAISGGNSTAEEHLSKRSG